MKKIVDNSLNLFLIGKDFLIFDSDFSLPKIKKNDYKNEFN